MRGLPCLKGAGEFSTRVATLDLVPDHKFATTPGTWMLGAALDQSQPLTRLLQRLQESNRRFEALREHLPDTLRGEVRPGPLDDAGWTLLARGGAAAAKLRQLLPSLQAALQERGFAALPIRVRVHAERA
jgi:hypothetical protein